jgi:hypothetical protein
MARIIGLLFCGFMARLYGAAIAVYVGLEAVRIVTDTLGSVTNAIQ